MTENRVKRKLSAILSANVVGYSRYLIAVFLIIVFVGCSGPTTESIDKRQDPNVTPEGIRITPDVVYGHKFGMALTFDMYQPQNSNGAGVIWINSGGWVSNKPNFYKQTTEGLRLATLEDLETMVIETGPINLRGFNIEPLLAKGFTVFAVRHGSSPKFKMLEIVNDLRRAVRFIRYHAEKYGVNAERLGLWGGSAGGHLSLLLATTTDIGNPDAIEEFEKGSGSVAAVVVYFPPTDLKRWTGFAFKAFPDILKNISALDLELQEFREFSPIYFVSPDDPPTLIIHGDKDPGVPIVEGESMYQALLKADVQSKFVIIPGAGHGFEGEDADLALAESVEWFSEHLAE